MLFKNYVVFDRSDQDTLVDTKTKGSLMSADASIMYAMKFSKIFDNSWTSTQGVFKDLFISPQRIFRKG
jgi:hypothetical protein